MPKANLKIVPLTEDDYSYIESQLLLDKSVRLLFIGSGCVCEVAYKGMLVSIGTVEELDPHKAIQDAITAEEEHL